MIEYVAKASCKGLVKGIASTYCPKHKDRKEFEETLLSYVDDLTVEDVVAVIRCKDCHRRWHDGYCSENRKMTSDNEFCSRAVRKVD